MSEKITHLWITEAPGEHRRTYIRYTYIYCCNGHRVARCTQHQLSAPTELPAAQGSGLVSGEALISFIIVLPPDPAALQLRSSHMSESVSGVT